MAVKKCPNCRGLTTDEELASYSGRCVKCRSIPVSGLASASPSAEGSAPRGGLTARGVGLCGLVVLAGLLSLAGALFTQDALRREAKYGDSGAETTTAEF